MCAVVWALSVGNTLVLPLMIQAAATSKIFAEVGTGKTTRCFFITILVGVSCYDGISFDITSLLKLSKNYPIINYIVIKLGKSQGLNYLMICGIIKIR